MTSPQTGKDRPPLTRWNRFWGYPCLFGLVVLFLDQLTKFLIDWLRPVGWGTSVIDGFFNLVHWRNTGAAWGIFSEHTWLLGLLSLACFIALIVCFDSLSERKTFPALLLGVLSGGIAGNMIDRLFRSSVIDFLDFHWYETYHYPAFNVADISICVSISLLIIYSFFAGIKAKKGTDSTK